MPHALPSHPNLDQLKHQAKDVLKAHRSGDAAGCAVLRNLRALAQASNAELLAARVTLNDAQHALAQDYGFRSWATLKRFVDRAARRRQPGKLSAEAEGRLTSREPEPAEAAAKKEMAESVMAAIRSLPEPKRTVTTSSISMATHTATSPRPWKYQPVRQQPPAHLETFRHGMPPHGEIATGVERLLKQMLSLSNVKEASAFPRDRCRFVP
jgi:hypothetical protein